MNHTSGPWKWFVNTKSNTVYLATPNRGRLSVMDFVRWGMQNAQPRFREDDLLCYMRSAKELVEPDHNGAASEIDHPDAKLIAAAPDLLEVLWEIEWKISLNEFVDGDYVCRCPYCGEAEKDGHADDCLLDLALNKAGCGAEHRKFKVKKEGE